MVARKVSDQDLLQALQTTRSTSKLAAQFNVSTRTMVTRMRELGVPAAANWKEAQASDVRPTSYLERSIGRMRVDLADGVMVVFSDAHFQPGVVSTANRALLKLLPVLKPQIIVCNGDAFDGAAISRHPVMFGEKPPSPMQELTATQERLKEISDLCKGAKRVWCLGNHDVRLHAYLATAAPQLIDMPGLDLRTLFTEWDFAWSLWVNDSCVVKHRWKSGMYAPANHVRGSMMSFVTGHLHSMKVMPISTYSGRDTMYGVDTGMLAEPEWQAFAYREDSPADWRSGFVVMTWRGGRLLWPEVVNVVEEGVVEFRGELMEV